MLHVLRLFGGNGIGATQNSNIVSPNVVYFIASGYFVKVGVTSNAGYFLLWTEICFICKLLVILFRYLLLSKEKKS